MAFLNRFLLRIGLLVSIILLVASLSLVGVLINAAQNTIVDVEQERKAYVGMDNRIIQLTEDSRTLLNQIIGENVKKAIRSDYGADISDIVTESPFQFKNLTDQAFSTLRDREAHEYRMDNNITSTLFDYETLGIGVPNFAKYMYTTDEASAAGQDGSLTAQKNMQDVVQSNIYGYAKLSAVVTNIVDGVNRYNKDRNSLNASYVKYQGNLTIYEETLNTFFNEIYASNNITLVKQLVNATRNLDSIVSEMDDFINQYLITTATNIIDLEINIQNINKQISNYTELIFNQTSYLDNFTSHPDIANSVNYETLLQSFNQTLLLSVVPEVSTSFIAMNSMYGEASDIEQIIRLDFNEIQDNVELKLETVSSIVTKERDDFVAATEQYIRDIRNRLSFISSTIFVIIIIFITAILLILFIFLTFSLSRVLKKNRLLAEGILNFPASRVYLPSEFGILDASVDQVSGRLREILGKVQQTSEILAGIAEELAAGAEEASASINDVANTIREFSAGSAEQNLLISRVRANLQDHRRVIEETANQIEATATFVQRVAKQTNILGLNASIEAAKAGRYGLGFNVVAEEVRKLSDETTDSAGRIQSSIETIDYNIRRTVDDIMNEVSIIGEVAENTAAGSEEANASASEQVIMLNEMSETSNQLSQLSQELNELMRGFQL